MSNTYMSLENNFLFLFIFSFLILLCIHKVIIDLIKLRSSFPFLKKSKLMLHLKQTLEIVLDCYSERPNRISHSSTTKFIMEYNNFGLLLCPINRHYNCIEYMIDRYIHRRVTKRGRYICSVAFALVSQLFIHKA